MSNPAEAEPNDGIRLGRVAVALAATWFVVHVAIYICHLDNFLPLVPHPIYVMLLKVFGCQAAGLIIVMAAVQFVRPALVGRAFVLFLMLSTLALVVCSRNAALIGELCVLVLWAACAVNGVRLAPAWSAGERYSTWGVAAVVTYAALIPICFLLGILHAIIPWTVGLLAVASALHGLADWLRRLPTVLRNIARPSERLGTIEICLLETIWIILAIGFVFASTGEVLSDSVRVHLPYMHQVLADHGISHQYACWHRLQPMAAQTCGAVFACLGSDLAAKWYSWLVMPALVLLMAEEVFRRSRSLKLGLFAGAVVLGCPLLPWLSTSSHVDHLVTLLCTAGFVVLFRALRPPCLRGILLSAAIMGSVAQVKYTSLVFCVVWGVFLTVALLRQCPWRVALLWSAAAGMLLAVVASPWYVYVYLGTGNPFFPYLHSWFPSPYWVDGFTLREVFEQSFKLKPGLGGVLSFPWLTTFETHHFVEQPDGCFGFWILALVPCWFLARSRRAPPYWDMAIVALAMIAGIVSYTPYIRYWLPAYPLLAASCVLAAGAWTDSLGWRAEGRWRPLLSGVGLAALLLLPMPYLFSCLYSPWEEYTGKASIQSQWAIRYPECPAVERLNQILAPGDGVLCTGCDGIHMVHGRAYEFAPWWNRLHHIQDVQSFTDFCRRNRICYWVVNSDSLMARAFKDGAEHIPTDYWTDARLVTAVGSVAVYDVTPQPAESGQAVVRRDWPAMLEKIDQPWLSTNPASQWIYNMTPDASPRPAEGAIMLEGQSHIRHRLPPVSPGGMCRVQFDFWSKEISHPLLEISWHDAAGNLLANKVYGPEGQSDFTLGLFLDVPPAATIGWAHLWEWKGQPLRLKHAVATCWTTRPKVDLAARWTQASPAVERGAVLPASAQSMDARPIR